MWSQKIVPVPQKVRGGEKRVKIASIGNAGFKITVKTELDDLGKNAYSMLVKHLSEKTDACSCKFDGDFEISLSMSADVPKEVKKNKEQAYSIKITANGAELIGYGDLGLYYAVTTLLQCVEIEDDDVYLPIAEITDWPDLKTRGHFVECRYGSNLMTLDDWKEVVDDMTGMKMNQLVVALYGCWCVQYDGIISEYVYIPVEKYPKLKSDVIKRYYSPKKKKWVNETVPVPMAEEDFFGELIAYGKIRGVEVLPLWNSYGHNTLIPRSYPEVSALDEKGKPTGHGFCVSNEKVYDMLFDIFDGIIDKYLKPNGIKSFHIGMDEVRDERATNVKDVFEVNSPWCKCPKCSKLTNEEKFLNHAIRLIKHLKEKGMENVYIYSDMMDKIIDPKKFRDILEKNDLLDVTIIDWWSYSNSKEAMMFDTIFPELGIRATVKPWNTYYHWNILKNSVPNVKLLAEVAHNENAEGLQSYAAWDKCLDRNHVSMADYSWNYEGTGSELDYYDRYTERLFGAEFNRAKHAFALMDAVIEEKECFVGWDELIAKGEMPTNGLLMGTYLAYYFYTYVKPGKPYPRNFPGETMESLVRNKEMYVEKLREFSAMSRNARDIFDDISNNPECDTMAAKRYACEAENHLCIADDYLALLEMHGIIERDDSEAREKVMALASSRKRARLEHMLRMEDVKEDYLIPCHLRNQSIFMQLFADIEKYAKEHEKMNLNMLDLRDIGSTAFYKLR